MSPIMEGTLRPRSLIWIPDPVHWGIYITLLYGLHSVPDVTVVLYKATYRNMHKKLYDLDSVIAEYYSITFLKVANDIIPVTSRRH
jgi:hypothetical protein